jgi:hypothetical protein
MISGELLKETALMWESFKWEGSTETIRAIKAILVLEESTLKWAEEMKKLSNNNFQFTDKVGKVEMIDNSGKR